MVDITPISFQRPVIHADEDQALADFDPAVAAKTAHKLLTILDNDRNDHLLRIDSYIRGDHDDPYMPDRADEEYKLLASRAISNWCPLLVSTPAQAMYVDSFRRGRNAPKRDDESTTSPEWDHWEGSRLSARQNAIHRAAVGYGHSFTVTLKDENDRIRTKGLSPLRTAAIFEDPANDEIPVAAITVHRWFDHDKGANSGRATMWIDDLEFPVAFGLLTDVNGLVVGPGFEHGTSECPVTRFTAHIDLDGRTTGVIEPIIPLQNRINQTVFDLLVSQTFGSFKVRTITGMAPPLETKPVYADPDDPTSGVVDTEVVLDDQGAPIAKQINLNARRFMFAEDHEARFGTLDETPLGGFIESIDMSVRHLSAVSQTPPHHLLGQIANLSAEALQAAETSLSRMVEGFRKSFGESWERVFRLAAELAGDQEMADDHSGEVIWRDMELRSLAQSADALGKLKEQLGIPAKGLWPRVPGATKAELDQWAELAENESPELALAASLARATTADQINLGEPDATSIPSSS